MGDLGIKLPKLIPSGRYRCRFSASLDPNPRATAIDRLPFHLSCLSWRIRGCCDQGWYDGRDARFIVKVWHAVNALEMSYSEEQAILSTVIPYHLNSRKMSAIEESAMAYCQRNRASPRATAPVASTEAWGRGECPFWQAEGRNACRARGTLP
jgi:hypothetical protein